MSLVPKERPRSGKNGHMYTPKRTQDCEKRIATFCKDAPFFLFPIKLDVSIQETAPKNKAHMYRFIRPSKSDVDNKLKTLTDALNGVLYKDDRQVSAGAQSCRYTLEAPNVVVTVYRDGLSLVEMEQVAKLLPHV